MKENGVEMLEFILKYGAHFILGGEAERIFKTNFDTLRSIATTAEEKKLDGMYKKMLDKTRFMALKSKDTALYNIFIDRWKGNALNDKNAYRLAEYQLELIYLQGNGKEYKKLATKYLDSLILSQTIEQIHQADHQSYLKMAENMKNKSGSLIDKILDDSKIAISRRYIGSIISVSNRYLEYVKGKKEFEKVLSWVTFGKKLIPENAEICDFYSVVIYQMGKREEAIRIKEELIKANPDYKGITLIKTQLNEWKKDKK